MSHFCFSHFRYVFNVVPINHDREEVQFNQEVIFLISRSEKQFAFYQLSALPVRFPITPKGFFKCEENPSIDRFRNYLIGPPMYLYIATRFSLIFQVCSFLHTFSPLLQSPAVLHLANFRNWSPRSLCNQVCLPPSLFLCPLCNKQQSSKGSPSRAELLWCNITVVKMCKNRRHRCNLSPTAPLPSQPVPAYG